MLVEDRIGIIVGEVFCKRLPQRTFKWLSATIFVVFGLIVFYDVLPAKIGLGDTTTTLAVLTVLSFSAMFILARKQRLTDNFAENITCKNQH